jgi:branched-chain amino acid transport system ATP-binding protein
MSAPSTPLIIDAQGVQAWYGSSHILHGLDFKLAKGETVGLLGRNGMGKSTLIRTLLGHVRQRQGRIHVAGKDLSKGLPHQAAQLGVAYVPEGRGIFPTLTVRENLVMAARAGTSGQKDWTFDRVMTTFPRLSERLTNLGSQLSGGEQQMLSIGRPLIVQEIWRVIADIRRTGIATLIVDRDYRKVCAESDRLVVLQKGRLVLEGASDTLRNSTELAGYLGV